MTSRYQKGMRTAFEKRFDYVGGDEEEDEVRASDFGYGISPEWPRFYRHILIRSRDAAGIPDRTSLQGVVAHLIAEWATEVTSIDPNTGRMKETVPYSWLSRYYHIFLDSFNEEIWDAFQARPEEAEHPPPNFVVLSREIRKNGASLDEADPDALIIPTDTSTYSLKLLNEWAKAMDGSRTEDQSVWISILPDVGKYARWFVKGVQKTAETVKDVATKPIVEIWDVFKKVLLFTGLAFGGVIVIMLAGNFGGRGGGRERALPESPRTKTKAEVQGERVRQRIEEKSK